MSQPSLLRAFCQKICLGRSREQGGHLQEGRYLIGPSQASEVRYTLLDQPQDVVLVCGLEKLDHLQCSALLLLAAISYLAQRQGCAAAALLTAAAQAACPSEEWRSQVDAPQEERCARMSVKIFCRQGSHSVDQFQLCTTLSA